MKSGQEIRPLIRLRGVAAIYVMLFHYVLGLPFSNPGTTFLAHGYLAVDLFFVLSGFVMALNYGHMFRAGLLRGSYVKFLGRRVARVYPLYFAMTLVAGVLALTGILTPVQVPVPFALVTNLLMVQSWGLTESLDSPAWSISAEWAAYLLFPAILAPCLFRRPSRAWLVLFACVGLLAVLCVVPQSWGHRPRQATLLDLHTSFLAMPVVRCLPEFALGILAFRASATPYGLALARSRWLSVVICLGIILLLMVPRTDLLVVLLFPFLVVSLTSEQHLPGRILASPLAELAGLLSYSIYLTHDLLGGVTGRVHGAVERLGLTHAQTYAAVVGVVLTFPCAYLAYRFIEVPGRRWLRLVFEGSAPVVPIAAEPGAP